MFHSIFGNKTDRIIVSLIGVITLSVLFIGVSFYHLDFSAGKYLENDPIFERSPRSGYYSCDITGLVKALPSDAYIANSITHGELPVWNRMQAGGFSPAIELTSGFISPIRWIIALFVWPRLLFSAMMVFSWGIACAGLYILCRHFQCSVMPSILATCSWLCLPSSFVFSHLEGTLLVYSLLPWIMLSILNSRIYFDKTFVAQSVIVSLMITSGHPEIVYVCIVGIFIYCAIYSVISRDISYLFRYIVSGIFGTCFSAIALFPFVRIWEINELIEKLLNDIMYSFIPIVSK